MVFRAFVKWHVKPAHPAGAMQQGRAEPCLAGAGLLDLPLPLNACLRGDQGMGSCRLALSVLVFGLLLALSSAPVARKRRCRDGRRRCRANRSARGHSCRRLASLQKGALLLLLPARLLVVLSPLHDGQGRPPPLHALFPHPRGRGAVLQGRSRNRSDQVGFAPLVLFCAAYSGIANFSSLFNVLSLTRRIRAERNTGVPSRGLPLAVGAISPSVLSSRRRAGTRGGRELYLYRYGRCVGWLSRRARLRRCRSRSDAPADPAQAGAGVACAVHRAPLRSAGLLVSADARLCVLCAARPMPRPACGRRATTIGVATAGTISSAAASAIRLLRPTDHSS